MPLKEQVYLTLNGLLREEYVLPDVENLFAPDGRGYALYSEVLDAYASICDRLGVGETDADVETIINNLLALCEEVSYRMYDYGAKFSCCEMQNSRSHTISSTVND